MKIQDNTNEVFIDLTEDDEAIQTSTVMKKSRCSESNSQSATKYINSSGMYLRQISDIQATIANEVVRIESKNEGLQANTGVMRNSRQSSPIYMTTANKILTIKKNNMLYKIQIPHNVIPNLNCHKCPVMINVPGVGPLAIQLDPFAKKNVHPVLCKPTSNDGSFPHSLTYLCTTNMNNTLSVRKDLIDEKKPEPTSDPKKQVTFDKRFCWLASDSSSHYYKGFKKNEYLKLRKCLLKCNNIIGKRKVLLNRKIMEYDKYKKGDAHKVKTVKISNIVGNELTQNKETNKLSEISSTEPHTMEPIDLASYPNLLIPKKVVILKEGKEYKKNTIELVKENDKIVPVKNNYLNKFCSPSSKPCFVELTRDPSVEQEAAQMNLLNRKSKRNVSRYVHNLFIDTEAKFKQEIAYIKPMLLINEHNYKNINSYTEQFSKMNIVYSLKKGDNLPKSMLEDYKFCHAIVNGYVKIINQELVCRYLSKQL